MNRRESLWTLGSAFTLLSSATPSTVAKPTGMAMELVVPFSAGGISSQLAQFLSAELQRRGHQVTVQYKPDGTGMIASEYIERRASTEVPCVLVGGSSIYVSAPVANPAFYKEPLKQYELLTTVARSPQVLIARQDKLTDLAQLGRVKEKERICSVTGIGADSHLAYQYFKKTVMPLGQPFISGGDSSSIRRVLAGEVLLATVNLSSCMLFFEKGLSFLASTGAQALEWPDKKPTPTFASLRTAHLDKEELVYYGWDVLSAPRSLSPSVIGGLRAALTDVVQSPAMATYRQRYRQQDWSMTDTEFAAFVEKERKKWSEVIQWIGIEEVFD